MFERFTDGARAVVKRSQQEARELRHAAIGTEHLLLALLADTAREPARVLGELGLDHARAKERITRYTGSDDLDADALGLLGIDLDTVREKVEEVFGPGALDRPPGSAKSPRGHIPFTSRAKKVLELALREAIRLKHNYITDGHILLGILREGDGLAMKVITEAGIRPDAVRERLTCPLRE
ncbi:Clp protease N-terminal domain-containing protein [Thermostaphylospora chromogena]|uniref:Clp amino terminal domain-containing protein, pathogenicity island component n=1 Tax=Thermostaphylospora chromogena TaxID=35622 RepID=A0A1H1B1Y3_9ACTN|nr:Clp protease N-terminal domain-containing protein [Thermostaphylospora chromogena]SDQ45965.1 Clp amino terminal domain-containing protein, pathogenicity island component [Thermostaphylospora chromogena]